MLKVNDRNTQIIYAFLLIRILLLYISTYIASNIMNQIYSERVLISGVEPQPLNYQLYLFIAIDIVLNLFLLGFIFGFTKLTNMDNDIIQKLLFLGVNCRVIETVSVVENNIEKGCLITLEPYKISPTLASSGSFFNNISSFFFFLP